jgi:truncated hemoglobin YjbI
MERALDEVVADEPLRRALHAAMAPLATHMINRPG